ncbi:MAG: hypothetical protein E7111_00290 [Bacteroidales bacterium]|nr:hypothetical protein [Bacteroidales bacterium]
MKRVFLYISILITTAFLLSCSTTRSLQADQYRLASNRIEIVNDKDFNPDVLTDYLKQKHRGWTPFQYVYNWTNGKGKGWDKFVQKIGVAPVVYDPEMVDSSIENLTNHLSYLGYYGSKVTSSINVKKRNVRVTYKVRLGKQIPIKAMEIVLPDDPEFVKDFLADSTASQVKAGTFLSEAALEQESIRSSAAMQDKGYFSFSKNNYFFEADTLSYTDSALLKLTIHRYTRNEGPESSIPIRRFYLDSVSIDYPKTLKIRTKVLEGLNTLIPGERYSAANVNNTYSRLNALRVFSGVNIDMNPVDTNRLNATISLTQSKLQGFKVNLETSVNASGLFGVSPQLSYYHKNIFRGGEWLNLSFMGNFQYLFKDKVRSNEFGVSGGLSFPKFFPLPYRYFKEAVPRTDVNLSYNFQERPEFTRNIISISYGYTGNVKSRFYYQVFPLQMNIINLFNLDSNFYESLANDPFLKNAYQNHFDLGSGGTLYYTTNSASIPRTTFFYSRLQFDIAGNLLSAFKPLMKKDEAGAGMLWNTPFSQFVRGEISVGKTWVFGRKSGQTIATRFVAGAGYAYGNSSALPFEKHFYVGGSNSMRGWQARTLGPGLSERDRNFVIPNQTGDMRLEANIEYRFDIYWKFAGALFIDAGNVWTLQGSDNELGRFRWSTLGKSMAANWGVGLRLDFDFLLLRLDLGMRVHDPARSNRWVGPKDWLKKDGYALHFGVGYPF